MVWGLVAPRVQSGAPRGIAAEIDGPFLLYVFTAESISISDHLKRPPSTASSWGGRHHATAGVSPCADHRAEGQWLQCPAESNRCPRPTSPGRRPMREPASAD